MTEFLKFRKTRGLSVLIIIYRDTYLALILLLR